MPTIYYIQHDGSSRAVDVPLGTSVMRGATDNAVLGIDGDCGGECACGTCHVHIESRWLASMGPIQEREREMLNFVEGVEENSRLSCQIRVTEELDGMKVYLPVGQH
jgi:2Fe-2S ferredoxin